MENVIVIPETEDYKLDVLYDSIVYINQALGVPKLKEHNVKYCAPFWLKYNAVYRLYEINNHGKNGSSYFIELGTGFLLPQPWNNMGQRLRFEYHQLSSFGVVPCSGTILKYI
ncbi:hypothetical protein E4O05_07545 [Treponema sp. OMZ 787]|uniref:hypothetical protein n=1 Tax=Treponema sp. OMZ 787 TaxID=2563669 RepID=UPI0020A290DD|nr:hypothetical protein [Treponema sp. OMZ 787]UTC61414.1 hypothetical protein E4O05_07545 [Treponema sp. OMZ 787]